MAKSQLTVRTLALAMVALVLACVHAARGDGKGVATIGSGARGGSVARSAPSHSSGVVTVKGEPWKAGPEQRSAAKTRPSGGSSRVAAYRPRRDPSIPREEPICIVRRVSSTQPVAGQTAPGKLPLDKAAQQATAKLRAQLPAAAPKGVAAPAATVARNAFALSPIMGSGIP